MHTHTHTVHLGWNSPLGRGAELKAKVSLNSHLNPSDQKIMPNPMDFIGFHWKLHLCDLEPSAEKSVGLWVRKQRSLKLKSLPLNPMNLSQCERGETEDVLIVIWAGIFMPQTWVHGVNRMRQVNCTQWAVKAGSSIHVESQFTPQLGSGGAAVTEQGSELQSAFSSPLFFFLSQFQWMLSSRTQSCGLPTTHPGPQIPVPQLRLASTPC